MARKPRVDPTAWRWKPKVKGEQPTLGWQIIEWIETWCVNPDGPRAGEPFELTDEQCRFILEFYRLRVDAVYDPYRPSAPFVYMHGELVRPQKWGKGPLAAAIILAEAMGPVRFGGWDEDGEPIGLPVPTPWIQLAAASEGQTDNVWRALLGMIQLGPLNEQVVSAGLAKVDLPNGGWIEPVTSSSRSRLGQRLTFALRDEVHSWLENNDGWFLADTMRRNLAGMGGRSIGTSNAYDPAENSDLQRTYEAKLADTLIDWPTPPAGSLKNKRERRKVLRFVYGDSYWVDLDRIEADIDALIAKNELSQAERFFANRVVQLANSYFDAAPWVKIARPDILVPAGARITLGFDGSKVDDWTALRARWVRADGTMHAFQPAFSDDGAPMWWNPAKCPDGEVPVGEVLAAIEDLFAHYTVLRMYADPPYWQTEVDELAAKHPKKVIAWETYRRKQMAAALERLKTDMGTAAIASGDERRLTQDGDAAMLDHLRHARAVRRPGGTTIGKPQAGMKIDIAMADVLAHEAAADAIAAGEHVPKKRKRATIRGYS